MNNFLLLLLISFIVGCNSNLKTTDNKIFNTSQTTLKNLLHLNLEATKSNDNLMLTLKVVNISKSTIYVPINFEAINIKTTDKDYISSKHMDCARSGDLSDYKLLKSNESYSYFKSIERKTISKIELQYWTPLRDSNFKNEVSQSNGRVFNNIPIIENLKCSVNIK